MDSSFLLLLSLLNLVLVFLSSQAEARAFIVFGDSLVDNGNNDYLATTARADSYPYGIDYPTHRPTGRFSNGLNIPDIISRVLRTFVLFVVVHDFVH
jgi:phospholipase/lecithinase/hemolysin